MPVQIESKGEGARLEFSPLSTPSFRRLAEHPDPALAGGSNEVHQTASVAESIGMQDETNLLEIVEIAT